MFIHEFYLQSLDSLRERFSSHAHVAVLLERCEGAKASTPYVFYEPAETDAYSDLHAKIAAFHYETSGIQLLPSAARGIAVFEVAAKVMKVKLLEYLVRSGWVVQLASFDTKAKPGAGTLGQCLHVSWVYDPPGRFVCFDETSSRQRGFMSVSVQAVSDSINVGISVLNIDGGGPCIFETSLARHGNASDAEISSQLTDLVNRHVQVYCVSYCMIAMYGLHAQTTDTLQCVAPIHELLTLALDARKPTPLLQREIALYHSSATDAASAAAVVMTSLRQDKSMQMLGLDGASDCLLDAVMRGIHQFREFNGIEALGAIWGASPMQRIFSNQGIILTMNADTYTDLEIDLLLKIYKTYTHPGRVRVHQMIKTPLVRKADIEKLYNFHRYIKQSIESRFGTLKNAGFLFASSQKIHRAIVTDMRLGKLTARCLCDVYRMLKTFEDHNWDEGICESNNAPIKPVREALTLIEESFDCERLISLLSTVDDDMGQFRQIDLQIDCIKKVTWWNPCPAGSAKLRLELPPLFVQDLLSTFRTAQTSVFEDLNYERWFKVVTHNTELGESVVKVHYDRMQAVYRRISASCDAAIHYLHDVLFVPGKSHELLGPCRITKQSKLVFCCTGNPAIAQSVMGHIAKTKDPEVLVFGGISWSAQHLGIDKPGKSAKSTRVCHYGLSVLLEKMHDLYKRVIEKLCSVFGKALARDYHDVFTTAINTIGTIDAAVSISRAKCDMNMVDPTIIDGDGGPSYFDAKSLSHPYINHQLHTGRGRDSRATFSVFDLQCGGNVVYGANTNGKSTLLRTAGIAVVMAQAGFGVQASRFELRPYGYMITHINSKDSMEAQKSKFDQEVASMIPLDYWPPMQTLVLFDELFSSTANRDADKLIAATIEIMAIRGTSFCVSSHSHEAMQYVAVENRGKFKVIHVHKNEGTGSRTICSGQGPDDYPLVMFETCGGPPEIAARARHIMSQHPVAKRKRSNGNGLSLPTSSDSPPLIQPNAMPLQNSRQYQLRSRTRAGRCENPGCVSVIGPHDRELATQYDHVVPQEFFDACPQFEQYRNHDANLCELCTTCHAKKTTRDLGIKRERTRKVYLDMCEARLRQVLDGTFVLSI